MNVRSVFAKKNKEGYIPVTKGIKRKTLVFGKKTLMTEFILAKDSDLPSHSHPQEQTGYLVSGCIVLTIGGNAAEMRPGDSWIIPGNMEHGAKVLEDSVAIEVFSPRRDDYLPPVV